MTGDQMEANGSPPTDRLVELNHHRLQNGQNGVPGDRVCEEELRNSGINKRHAESVQVQVIKQTLQQQPRMSLVLWERFLPLRSVKVLLVENDDSTQQLLKALLRNCSYEVTAVADGLQAWKVLQDINSHIDLVLTELSLPLLSGISLLMKIKNHKTFKNIPVIMMSANDSTTMVYKCLSKGAADFLLKPIRKNELRNLWQHVWRKCHTSSCSGSESGIRTQKFKHSKSSDKLHSYNDCSDEDDTESVGLNARGGNDDISSTQSSWSKRGVEVGNLQPISPSNDLADASYCNSDQDISSRPDELRVPAESTIKNSKHDNVLDNTAMGQYLELGLLNNPDSELQGRGEEVFGSTVDTEMDKFPVLDSPDESNASKKEKVELRNKNSYPINTTTNGPMHPRVSVAHDESTQLSKITDNQHRAYGIPKEMPCLEVSLKQLGDTSHTGLDTLQPNRQREVSAFSRYNANTSSVNVGSHSPVNNSSEAAKIDYKQANTTLTLAKTLNLHNKVDNHHHHHHHRHHHYHHHHPYNIQQQQPLNDDDLSLENLNVAAANARPPDKLGKEMEGNGNNYGSASGSNEHNGSCGHHGSDKKAIVKCSACEGNCRGSETEVDQNRLTQREASLNKFRQKRKERCFEKKVRYDGRKRLAEQRPRVRGQFVRQRPENINQAENENRES